MGCCHSKNLLFTNLYRLDAEVKESEDSDTLKLPSKILHGISGTNRSFNYEEYSISEDQLPSVHQ